MECEAVKCLIHTEVELLCLCQVEYENHASFSGPSTSAGLKKESPVRIFTNLDPATVVLPASEGYWFVCFCFVLI